MNAIQNTVLRVYVIYDHPRDYPDHFVLRAWDVAGSVPVPIPELQTRLAATLDEARGHLPPDWLVNIGRQPDDDVAILEVWI